MAGALLNHYRSGDILHNCVILSDHLLRLLFYGASLEKWFFQSSWLRVWKEGWGSIWAGSQLLICDIVTWTQETAETLNATWPCHKKCDPKYVWKTLDGANVSDMVDYVNVSVSQCGLSMASDCIAHSIWQLSKQIHPKSIQNQSLKVLKYINLLQDIFSAAKFSQYDLICVPAVWIFLAQNKWITGIFVVVTFHLENPP